MNIWATVTFDRVVLTQEWELLEDEIGEDSQPHDYLLVMKTNQGKWLAIQLEKQFTMVVSSDGGAVKCYLATLHIGNARLLS
jgi:hypothetical protein